METSMNTCEWRKSPVFSEEYLVSSKGAVFSVRTHKELKPSTDKNGYLYYVLCVNGNRRTVKAHRLVAIAFIDNPMNKPTVNHKNSIKTDNRVENLEWATNKEQSNDPITYKKLIANSMKTDFRKMGERRNFGRKAVAVTFKNGMKKNYMSLKDAAIDLNQNYSHLSEIVNGKRKQQKWFSIKAI